MALPPLTATTDADQLIPPSQDPWYTNAPPNLEASAPGTVLRIRTVPGGVGPFSSAATAYHILYRTTGSHYQPTWALAYNTPNVDFSPSYGMFLPPQPNNYGIPTGHEKLNAMLERGWFVTMPDFEGPRAAFGATVQAGHATIDGIRAVLSLAGHQEYSLPDSADKIKYAMWGYSGGSLASEKAAELQVQYAPEMTAGFVGVALGGLVSSAASVWEVTNKSPYAGNLVLILLGTMNEYPEFDALVRSLLKTDGPQNAEAFLRGLNMNSLLAFQAFPNQDIGEYFVGGRMALEKSEVYRRIRKVEWTLGFHGCPTMPMYVYKAIADEMTPIADTDEQVAAYQRFGASILYERNTTGSHVPEIVNGENRAMKWLIEVLENSHAQEGVTIRDVTVDEYKPPML
ncbi:hypothetical protein G7054_g2873 [Neopestalotiopsis clavispora]|nr:hypothetical protein G7054_g2873 [Neopestalotiopsis clavispora]